MSSASIVGISDRLSELDRHFNQLSGSDAGFEALIGSEPYSISDEALNAARSRYEAIKAFQSIAMQLFRESLFGRIDPSIATGVLSDVPEGFGAEFHKQLPDSAWNTPVFFRTDESKPGQLTEIQCSGSGWDLAELLRNFYQRSPEQYGEPKRFPAPLAQSLKSALTDYLGGDPVVHHLVDSASRPHGGRYFIQSMRQEGVRYFSYDRDVRHSDCNFIRAHDCFSLFHHNFFKDRLGRSELSECFFDLPPLALFDTKLILSWPFWSRTRDFFPDSVRALFPYTALIEPDGVELITGEKAPLTTIAAIGNNQRNYFVKYAGTDVGRNWGSRAVFSLSRLSHGKCEALLKEISDEVRAGQPWILQESANSKEEVGYWTRETGEHATLVGNGKWSGFYGPAGLMGILVMHLGSQKVHGSDGTVMSLVY